MHSQVTGVTVYVGVRYGGWQEAVLRYLTTRFDAAARSFPADTTGAVRCSNLEVLEMELLDFWYRDLTQYQWICSLRHQILAAKAGYL